MCKAPAFGPRLSRTRSEEIHLEVFLLNHQPMDKASANASPTADRAVVLLLASLKKQALFFKENAYGRCTYRTLTDAS
jgi:hypothetical protein